MPSSHLKINNISLYFLPLAAFFLLISSAATNIFIVLSVISSIYLCIKNSDYEILIKENFFKVSILLYLLLVLSCICANHQIVHMRDQSINPNKRRFKAFAKENTMALNAQIN